MASSFWRSISPSERNGRDPPATLVHPEREIAKWQRQQVRDRRLCLQQLFGLWFRQSEYRSHNSRHIAVDAASITKLINIGCSSARREIAMMARKFSISRSVCCSRLDYRVVERDLSQVSRGLRCGEKAKMLLQGPFPLPRLGDG